MSKKIPQRNVNLANKLVATAMQLLNTARHLTETEMPFSGISNQNEEAMLDAISACREFRRKPIQRNDIT